YCFLLFQAEDGIRDRNVTGVQTCALPIYVALPSIMNEFAVKPTAVQWLSTGYMLINGILIPASAFFIQRFSNRSLFITAMSLFTAGTLLAGFSPTFGILLVAR